jgi:hypothetical protein
MQRWHGSSFLESPKQRLVQYMCLSLEYLDIQTPTSMPYGCHRSAFLQLKCTRESTHVLLLSREHPGSWILVLVLLKDVYKPPISPSFLLHNSPPQHQKKKYYSTTCGLGFQNGHSSIRMSSLLPRQIRKTH